LAFLILYNVLGYLIVFKSYQYAIKNEIKSKIRNAVPDKDLVIIKFSCQDIHSRKNHYKKTDDNEFRFGGKLYDIVRSKVNGDTTIFYCINDTREEQLYSNLDAYVKRYMDNNIPLKEKTNTLFKTLVKQALLHNYSFSMPDFSALKFITANTKLPKYFLNNIPGPPPKNLL
jgi:hypothetical protein